MIFENLEKMGHEQVVFCHDSETKLKAIIAIHDTTIGPALGGTRLWMYQSHDDAIVDALRLSRGMTYKAAISGLRLGGGKAVIIGTPEMKNEFFWRRYGKFVNSLNGKYITAEDVNTSAKDMEYIAMETKHVTGVPHYMGGSGDPSPFTAYGVYCGMKAAANKTWGKDSLEGKKIVVQGVGHVGQYLVGHLTKEGAKVMIADINTARIEECKQKYNQVEVIKNEDVFKTDMDIYAPCALGATLNSSTIPQLKCAIIAGAANNQLENENEHGPMLVEKSILYIPDFMLNAGGLINVAAELNTYNEEKVKVDTEEIYQRTLDVISWSESMKFHPQLAAMQMAQNRIDSVSKLKSKL